MRNIYQFCDCFKNNFVVIFNMFHDSNKYFSIYFVRKFQKTIFPPIHIDGFLEETFYSYCFWANMFLTHESFRRGLVMCALRKIQFVLFLFVLNLRRVYYVFVKYSFKLCGFVILTKFSFLWLIERFCPKRLKKFFFLLYKQKF